MKTTQTLQPKLRFPEFEDGGWVYSNLESAIEIPKRKVEVKTIPLENYASTENLMPDFKGMSIASNLPNIKSVTEYLSGDTLFANIRPYLKKAILATKQGGASNDVIVFRSRVNTLPEFLSHRIRSDAFVNYVMSGAKGLKMPRGDVDQMKAFPFPLPENKKEQQKIADCLGSLDELLTAHRSKLSALQDHKKGLLQQLFPTQDQTTPNLRFPEFKNDEDWKMKNISDFGQVVTGNTPNTKKREFYGGDRHFVSPADISDRRFIKSTKKTLTEPGFDVTRKIPAMSILFVCIGSTIGKISQNKQECATNQQINSIIPNKKHSNGFVYFCLNRHSQKISESAGKQAVPIINKSLFSSYELLAPEILEQQKIADCLSDLDALITAETESIEALQTHKKGLMQNLFPNP